MKKCDICVIGGGLVGKTAAIAFAQQGAHVILCNGNEAGSDPRTTALLMDSVKFLGSLGIWDKISAKAHPLKTMRIVDGSTRLLRTPQTDFDSSEIDLEAFGYNVQNAEFGTALDQKIANLENIDVVSGVVDNLTPNDQRFEINGRSFSIDAGFVVGADGKNSFTRSAVNAGEREWKYPQSALVLDFKHKYSSNFISTEFHTETGPFTIVPRAHTVAGLVWMEKPEQAQELATLPSAELAAIIERKMQSYLGEIVIITQAQSFPLKGLVARQFGAENWALIGEAAHVFPPIGAQGFNLGIRDIQVLAETLGRTRSDENRGHEYSRKRTADINIRTLGVDLLNRSLLSGFLPVQLMRGAGLHALGNLPSLRKAVMRMGISPKFNSK